MKKALGVIPARWKSTRFPGKPLQPIAGKQMLRRVWERCTRAKSLDQVIIATDDMRIANAAFGWGAEVALTSSRHKSGTDRIAEVARKADRFAFIINIQGDEPLIEPRLIDRLVHILRRHRDVDIVTAGHPFENPRDMESPHQVKVMIDRHGTAIDFTRKPPERASPADGRRSVTRYRVLRHQGIYAFRRSALLKFVNWKQTARERAEALEQLRALENGVKVHVLVTTQGSPGIDTPADAKALERKLARAKTGEAPVSGGTRLKSQATRLSAQR